MTLVEPAQIPLSEFGVAKLIAGTGISLSPAGGTGNVTVTSTASGGVSSLNALTGALSVTATGSTITVTPSGTSVNVDIALGHANTWTAVQTFGNNISFGGATVNISSLSSGQFLRYNGTNWVNSTVSVSARVTGQYTGNGAASHQITGLGTNFVPSYIRIYDTGGTVIVEASSADAGNATAIDVAGNYQIYETGIINTLGSISNYFVVYNSGTTDFTNWCNVSGTVYTYVAWS